MTDSTQAARTTPGGPAKNRSPRRRSSRVTVHDVAVAAGVSTQTVSRVVNRRPDVAEATREVVEDAIRRLNYQPSAAAQSLASQRSRTIGVAVVGLAYFGTAQTLSGIIAASAAAGFTVLVNETEDPSAQQFKTLFEPLFARQVEGIIYCGPEVGDNIDSIESAVDGQSVPIVLAHTSRANGRAAVVIDNAQGVRQTIDHLVAAGAEHIAHISGPLDWAEARERRDGWAAGLKSHGLEASANLLEVGDWSSASGAAALDRLLARNENIDAVVVGNDQMALGVLHRSDELGLRIPDDLKVTGFDDLAEASWFHPPLTTVRQPLFEAGSLAVKLMLDSLEDSESAKQAELPTELVIRESTQTKN